MGKGQQGLYQLGELGAQERANAIRLNRHINIVASEWWKPTLARYRGKGEALGFTFTNLYFNTLEDRADARAYLSGCFDLSAYLENRVNPTKGEQRLGRVLSFLDSPVVRIAVEWPYGYRFDGTLRLSRARCANVRGELKKIGYRQAYERLCAELTEQLKKEYKDLISDEKVAQYLTDHGYLFDRNGNG